MLFSCTVEAYTGITVLGLVVHQRTFNGWALLDRTHWGSFQHSPRHFSWSWGERAEATRDKGRNEYPSVLLMRWCYWQQAPLFAIHLVFCCASNCFHRKLIYWSRQRPLHSRYWRSVSPSPSVRHECMETFSFNGYKRWFVWNDGCNRPNWEWVTF